MKKTASRTTPKIPRTWTPERKAQAIERILEGVAEGRSVNEICSEPGMPAPRIWREWRNEEQGREIDTRYARAREGWAAHYENRIVTIVNDVLAAEIDPQAARVAIDAIKWIMSKAAPKLYGDHQQIDLNTNANVRLSAAECEARALQAKIDLERIRAERGEQNGIPQEELYVNENIQSAE